MTKLSQYFIKRQPLRQVISVHSYSEIKSDKANELFINYFVPLGERKTPTTWKHDKYKQFWESNGIELENLFFWTRERNFRAVKDDPHSWQGDEILIVDNNNKKTPWPIVVKDDQDKIINKDSVLGALAESYNHILFRLYVVPDEKIEKQVKSVIKTIFKDDLSDECWGKRH